VAALGLDGGGQGCPPYTNEHLGFGKSEGAEILRWQAFALRRPALPQDDSGACDRLSRHPHLEKREVWGTRASPITRVLFHAVVVFIADRL
jgi:hypothetical protein